MLEGDLHPLDYTHSERKPKQASSTSTKLHQPTLNPSEISTGAERKWRPYVPTIGLQPLIFESSERSRVKE
jgi:hypothetical protein